MKREKFTLSEHDIILDLLLEEKKRRNSEPEAAEIWRIIDKVRDNTENYWKGTIR